MAGEEAEPDLDIGVVGDNTELDIWQYDNQIQERTSLLTQKSKSGDIPNFNSSGYRNWWIIGTVRIPVTNGVKASRPVERQVKYRQLKQMQKR